VDGGAGGPGGGSGAPAAAGELAVARQAAKALANLAVLPENRPALRAAGAFAPLLRLAACRGPGAALVQTEAVAALSNLSVSDDSEAVIGQELGGVAVLVAVTRQALSQLPARLGGGGLGAGVGAAAGGAGGGDAAAGEAELSELLRQCARALRNLSVSKGNQALLRGGGDGGGGDGLALLRALAAAQGEDVRAHAEIALRNLGEEA